MEIGTDRGVFHAISPETALRGRSGLSESHLFRYVAKVPCEQGSLPASSVRRRYSNNAVVVPMLCERRAVVGSIPEAKDPTI